MQSSGHLHPLTWTIRECVAIFAKLGFQVVSGPELETASYNFDRLNFPPNHPARDMQDTLWVDAPSDAGGSARLMRTHTSPVQLRALERFSPPGRFIVPGRVYRNERSDATHAIDFFHLEGFVIERGITLAHLLETLEIFAKEYFGTKTTVRFRPSFFPFTEPSLEMAVNFRDTWLEMAGAGMIHPNVIREMGLDPNEWQGFAFGFGVDRLMMIRYEVHEIRWLYSGDYRFLKQFPGGTK